MRVLQSQTADAAEEAATQILRKLDNIDYVYIVVVIAVSAAAIWLIRRTVPYLAQFVAARYRLAVLGIVPIARLIILSLLLVLIIQEVLILSRENILVVGGALGVALGFGFKDLVSSIIAGIVAVFEKPYRPGDWVRVNDSYGEVKEIGLRSFQIVTPADDVVTVTHDRIWDTSIANSNDGAETLMCVADFYVHPDHDAESLRAALREVALTSPYLSYAKPAFVVLSEEPWGTHYKVKAYPFDMRDQFQFVSDMTVRGKQALRQVGAREVSVPVAMEPER